MARQPTIPHAQYTACPIAYCVDIIGDRWTLLIVRDLMFRNKRHYSEFLASEEGISTNILADRLSKLEDHGVVTRHLDERDRKRIHYRLTNKGKDLVPVMLELIQFSGKHDATTNAPKTLLRRLERDRESLMNEVLAELEDQEP